MNFIGVMILIILCLIAFSIINYSNNEDNPDSKWAKCDKRMVALTQGYYLGGSSFIQGSGYEVFASITEQGFVINGNHKRYEFPIKCIKNMSVKSEMEIKEHVTLGRLCALGVFAFAVPKKKKNIINYLVVEYEMDGKNDVMMLQLNKSNKILEAYENLRKELVAPLA